MKQKLENLNVPPAVLIGIPVILTGVLVGGTVLLKLQKKKAKELS